ncbi:MAG: hypothetical protein COB58_00145 [Thalassobium sp.]|nr:MAG: hypothetical protein COB43_09160 [Oceanospirillales bacterium]PHQ88332.1 MAG: hypothetical protein COB58_00145 [Thalassobium sp.]
MIFEAWKDECEVIFSTRDNILDQKKKGLISVNATFMYSIEAATYEEAMSLHYKKMEWEPYKK